MPETGGTGESGDGRQQAEGPGAQKAGDEERRGRGNPRRNGETRRGSGDRSERRVGRATALQLATNGFDVGLLARGGGGLEAAAKEIEAAGCRALPIPTDVSDYEQVDRAAALTQKELGEIDLWVNNAMTTVFAPIWEVAPADFKRAVDITFLGQVWGTRAALARMVPRDSGTIVNVGSALAFIGIPLQAAYCSSKFACRGFFESARAELIHRRSNVRMSMVHLPAVNTPQFGWCKSVFTRHPQPVPPIYEPEAAARFIIEIAIDGRREKVVGSWNKLLVAASKLLPGVANQYTCRNLGQPGVTACAISATDVAIWDLKARLLGLPLSVLLGRARDDVPVYGSGGFTTYSEGTTRSQLEHWVFDWELPRVKIKIGESWGLQERRDLRRVRLARKTVGEEVDLYVDANGAYTREQTIRLGRAMSEQSSVTWFEEPVSSDDLEGLREVRDQCPIDVATGEPGYSPWYFAPMIVAGAVDCLQADVTRCTGITGWLGAAHFAAANHLQVSGHCAPNLHAHVAVAVPSLRHVEYFHDHVRIEEMFFDGVLSPRNGAPRPESDASGHGMTLKVADSERYRIA